LYNPQDDPEEETGKLMLKKWVLIRININP
jgi:hypothetical protein